MVGLSPCCLYRVVETGFVDTGLPTPCYRGTALPREYGFSLIDSVAIAIHNFCKGLRTPREAPAKASHPVNPINSTSQHKYLQLRVSLPGEDAHNAITK